VVGRREDQIAVVGVHRPRDAAGEQVRRARIEAGARRAVDVVTEGAPTVARAHAPAQLQGARLLRGIGRRLEAGEERRLDAGAGGGGLGALRRGRDAGTVGGAGAHPVGIGHATGGGGVGVRGRAHRVQEQRGTGLGAAAGGAVHLEAQARHARRPRKGHSVVTVWHCGQVRRRDHVGGHRVGEVGGGGQVGADRSAVKRLRPRAAVLDGVVDGVVVRVEAVMAARPAVVGDAADGREALTPEGGMVAGSHGAALEGVHYTAGCVLGGGLLQQHPEPLRGRVVVHVHILDLGQAVTLPADHVGVEHGLDVLAGSGGMLGVVVAAVQPPLLSGDAEELDGVSEVVARHDVGEGEDHGRAAAIVVRPRRRA